MFLKLRKKLGYESVCREVADSITCRRSCRIPLDGQAMGGAGVDKAFDAVLWCRRALARDRLDAAITEIDTWTWLINQYEPAA
jgi:hypothetical protein